MQHKPLSCLLTGTPGGVFGSGDITGACDQWIDVSPCAPGGAGASSTTTESPAGEVGVGAWELAGVGLSISGGWTIPGNYEHGGDDEEISSAASATSPTNGWESKDCKGLQNHSKPFLPLLSLVKVWLDFHCPPSARNRVGKTSNWQSPQAGISKAGAG